MISSLWPSQNHFLKNYIWALVPRGRVSNRPCGALNEGKAESRQEMRGLFEALQNKIEEAKAKAKLVSLMGVSDEDWEPLKGSIESWWNMIKPAFGDIKKKLNE